MKVYIIRISNTGGFLNILFLLCDFVLLLYVVRAYSKPNPWEPGCRWSVPILPSDTDCHWWPNWGRMSEFGGSTVHTGL